MTETLSRYPAAPGNETCQHTQYNIHNKVRNEAQGTTTKRIKVRQPSPATAPKTDRATSAPLNTSGGSFQNENNRTTRLRKT